MTFPFDFTSIMASWEVTMNFGTCLVMWNSFRPHEHTHHQDVPKSKLFFRIVHIWFEGESVYHCNVLFDQLSSQDFGSKQWLRSSLVCWKIIEETKALGGLSSSPGSDEVHGSGLQRRTCGGSRTCRLSTRCDFGNSLRQGERGFSSPLFSLNPSEWKLSSRVENRIIARALYLRHSCSQTWRKEWFRMPW